MSYLIGDDFYKSGLPELFALEEEFGAIADNSGLSVFEKCSALSGCLEKLSALVEEKLKSAPASAVGLIDEATRFVSESSPLMARGLVQNAFKASASGALTLHGEAVLHKLDALRDDLEPLSQCALAFKL